MMKVAIGLLVVAAAAVGGAYIFSASSFDPLKDFEAAKAAIKPGMTWTEVVDVAREPQRLVTISVDPKGLPRESEQNFDATMLRNEIDAKGFQHGFAFLYQFTLDKSLTVYFSNDGKVERVSELTLGALPSR